MRSIKQQLHFLIFCHIAFVLDDHLQYDHLCFEMGYLVEFFEKCEICMRKALGHDMFSGGFP